MPPRPPLQLSRRSWLVAGAATLVGCTLNPDIDQNGPDAPQARPLAKPPTTAWVLGSGGPRGFVHVGVLKALNELQLLPDLIVGASVGSLVGGLFAAGLSVSAIETLALELQVPALMRLAWWGSGAPLSGIALAQWVRQNAPQTRLEHMNIPMACVATRLADRVPMAFTAGDLGCAVQASSAIEGQFTPVRILGERYVDADSTTPLPVRVARALGAQRVLAVDASAHLNNTPPGAERFRESDLKKQALVDVDAHLADHVLKPDFGYWVSLSSGFRERAIQAGYRETLAQAAVLRALHTPLAH